MFEVLKRFSTKTTTTIMTNYNVGDKFQYETKIKGKSKIDTITIVAIHPWTNRIMFDNGLILHPCQL